MKRLFILLALGLGLFAAPAAQAQSTGCGVNYVPQVGINCANVRVNTYVGQIIDAVPAAAATDFYCVDASASKTVTIRRVRLSGTATSAANVPLTLIRRNTLDSGGTTGTLYTTSNNPANPTATATTVYYTANPTINDSTSHQTIRATELTLGSATLTAGELPAVLDWELGTPVDAYDQGAVLTKGSTQQFCLNWGGATTAGNAVYGYVEWTEE